MQTPNPEQPAPQPLTAEELARTRAAIEGMLALYPTLRTAPEWNKTARLLATIDQAQEQVRLLRQGVEYYANKEKWEMAYMGGSYLANKDAGAFARKILELVDTTPAPQQGEEGEA